MMTRLNFTGTGNPSMEDSRWNVMRTLLDTSLTEYTNTNYNKNNALFGLVISDGVSVFLALRNNMVELEGLIKEFEDDKLMDRDDCKVLDIIVFNPQGMMSKDMGTIGMSIVYNKQYANEDIDTAIRDLAEHSCENFKGVTIDIKF